MCVWGGGGGGGHFMHWVLMTSYQEVAVSRVTLLLHVCSHGDENVMENSQKRGGGIDNEDEAAKGMISS